MMGPRHIRILIADDSADFRLLLRMRVETDGRFEIVGEAADGREAVAIASSAQPDIVLLDLAMPEMDGLQAAHFIHETSPESKIVVLTGLSGEPFESKAREVGVSRFLEKGTPIDEVMEEIEHAYARPEAS